MNYEALSEEEKLDLVKYSWLNIQHIENPSPQVQYLAVRIHPEAIKFIKNPTEQVQIFLLKSNQTSWKDIWHINFSEDVKVAAFSQNPRHLHYFINYDPLGTVFDRKNVSKLVTKLKNIIQTLDSVEIKKYIVRLILNSPSGLLKEKVRDYVESFL
jgi:hypothetical protein